MNGILLNNVQKVLISYSACLLQDKILAETPAAVAAAAASSAMDVDAMNAEVEYEKRGKELVTNLLPNFDVWLRRWFHFTYVHVRFIYDFTFAEMICMYAVYLYICKRKYDRMCTSACVNVYTIYMCIYHVAHAHEWRM